jgi:hypothetical protein
MRIDEDGVIHFDAGGDVDPYFGIGSTTVIGQRLGGYSPTDFIQELLGDIGSTNVSPVGGGVGLYDPNLTELLGRDPTFEDVIGYVNATYNPETTSLTQRKTAFDELMSRYGVSVPAGAPPPESFLAPPTPVFIGQPTINIPGDSGGKAPIDRTTPAVTAPPGGNQYITSMAQAATPGAAAPTTATGPSTVALPGAATGSLFDLLPAPIQGAVTGAGNIIGGIGNVIGRGTNALFELINAPLPSLVVLNPTNQSGTIVIGKPTGSATPTIVGSMPTSGAPVGVYTGNPFIDGVLQKVFSRSSPGQSDPNLREIIKVVILEEIGKATGTNAGAISAAIQGDVQGLIDATTKVVLGVNQNVAELDERYKTQEDVNRAATVKNDTITGAVGNDTITGAVGNDTITGAEVKTEADKTKTVVNTGTVAQTEADKTKTVINKDTVAKTPPALEEVKVAKTPAALEEVKVAKRVSPDGPPLRTSPAPDLGSSGSPGSPGSPATPIQQPQSTQDMYSVSTEQAGLADIGTPYDLNASLIDNIMRILAERDAGAEETELYGGGSVNRYNATDELIKLLRG